MFKRHPILKYVLIRIFNYFFTIWAAATVAFFAFRMVPTNPVDAWVKSLERQYSVKVSNGPEMVAYYKEQFGLNGTVNIQSPTSNLAGTISSLPSSLRQVQSLQTGRCAALAAALDRGAPAR